MADGVQYRVATLDPEPWLGYFPPQLSAVRLCTMAQNAAPSPFPVDPSTTPQSGSSTSWVLDSLYPQILAGDLVVIETPSGLHAARVKAASIASIVLGSMGSPAQPILGKATQLDFWGSYELKRIHFRAIAAGRLTNAALAEIPVGALAATRDAAGAYLDLANSAKPSQFLVAGAGNAGAEVAGAIDIDGNGSAKLTATKILDSAADKLAIPVSYYGNLLKVTRGESVLNEVLGSGDSSKAFQKFRLKKKPLTYLPDPSRPGAVSPELQVRVNGILWRRVDSLVTAPKGQRVYIVRHDENGETDIIFGDEVRPPTGVSNIAASYRYGAGKAAPPAGQLTQIAGKVPGLGQLVAPLPAGGGADAESPGSVKLSAPRSMLSYGRAVSIDDYAAIAAVFPGVIAADVEWAWAKNAQTAGVQAWIIADGGTVAAGLQATLENAGDPLIAVTVEPAIPDSHDLNVTIAIAPDYLATDVKAAVARTLADPDIGLLAPPNIGIGEPLFRSRIAGAVGDVPGVAGIDGILVDGLEMANAILALQGHYLSFAVSVGAVS
jgi:predicted phage baseplate assembly protein